MGRDEVRVEIDAVKRKFHTWLHSAGHLLDSAFVNIGSPVPRLSRLSSFPGPPLLSGEGLETRLNMGMTIKNLILHCTAV